MVKTKLIRIIIAVALLAVTQDYSPNIVNQGNNKIAPFSYYKEDVIRIQERLSSEQKSENIQKENDQPQEWLQNDTKKTKLKYKTAKTSDEKEDSTKNKQSNSNKVYIDGFGYVEPAEPPTAIIGASDGDINKMVGEM
ncbi:MAG: hypothetical protein K5768_01985 [Firmicutes bacterium]|nr:hypothetical protein [Bacillota bacterium]